MHCHPWTTHCSPIFLVELGSDDRGLDVVSNLGLSREVVHRRRQCLPDVHLPHRLRSHEALEAGYGLAVVVDWQFELKGILMMPGRKSERRSSIDALGQFSSWKDGLDIIEDLADKGPTHQSPVSPRSLRSSLGNTAFTLCNSVITPARACWSYAPE